MRQKIAQNILSEELNIKFEVLPEQVRKFRNKVKINYTETRPLQLFIKNIAFCKHESGRIGCDACPVLEG